MRVITFPPITKRRAKFVGQKDLRLIIQQPNRLDGSLLEASNSGGLPFDDPVQWGRTAHVSREKLMRKLVFAILLIASPAWAQTKLLPKGAPARVDNCAPIGRTEDRQAGVFDEVREFAGATATAAAG
jgi:hypothetical protein